MTDAVQALHEHHHRGHARARDLRRVMQRPGRQAMHLTARLDDRLLAEPKEARIEVHRLDVPDALPADLAAALVRETLTGRARLGE